MNVKKEICKKLGITEFRYKEIMFETGMEYLKFNYSRSDAIYKTLTGSKVIWNWWRNQYEILDRRIVNYDIDEKRYRELHINLDYFPNERIVREALMAYEEALRELIDDKKEAAL